MLKHEMSLFTPLRLVCEGEPKPEVIPVGTIEAGAVEQPPKPDIPGALGELKGEVGPSGEPAGEPPKPEVVPAGAGGTIEPVPAGEPPKPEVVPAGAGGTIEPVPGAPIVEVEKTKTARRAAKKEKAKEEKEKKEFPAEIYSFEMSQYKEATEKQLEETYEALKKRLETDADSNITVVVKGTADKVKFRVDKKDKSKVDLHLGDEKWDEWRNDFGRVITDLVWNNKLEGVLGISADPNDPVRQAFESFKAEFSVKGLEALWLLPIDVQQTVMNHAIAYLRAEKLQLVLAEKFANVPGTVNFRIDTEWLAKKGGRISTVVGLEGWEEKPVPVEPVAPSVQPVEPPKAPEVPVPGVTQRPAEKGPEPAPKRPEEAAPVAEPVVPKEVPKAPEAPEFNSGEASVELISDVENMIATNALSVELGVTRDEYAGIAAVQKMAESYDNQIAVLREEALSSGDLGRLEADLGTLYQDYSVTFPQVLEEQKDIVDTARGKFGVVLDADRGNPLFESLIAHFDELVANADKEITAKGPLDLYVDYFRNLESNYEVQRNLAMNAPSPTAPAAEVLPTFNVRETDPEGVPLEMSVEPEVPNAPKVQPGPPIQ